MVETDIVKNRAREIVETSNLMWINIGLAVGTIGGSVAGAVVNEVAGTLLGHKVDTITASSIGAASGLAGGILFGNKISRGEVQEIQSWKAQQLGEHSKLMRRMVRLTPSPRR